MPRDLHLSSPPLAGPGVLRIQTKLATLGYDPGPLDGIYGVTTTTAVLAFQREGGLTPDGVVGPATRAALRAARPPAAPEPDARPGEVGLRALAEAAKHVGVKERPRGSNRTPFGRWFGVDGVPWCNIFLSYCFSVGAGYVLCAGFAGAGVYPKGCTYVPTTEAWLRATGMWRGRASPRPGDIVVFDWDGGDPDHIGIVERGRGNGEVETIEGNTGIGNDSNGGEVMRRVRYARQIGGLGRVVR